MQSHSDLYCKNKSAKDCCSDMSLSVLIVFEPPCGGVDLMLKINKILF